MRLGLIGSPNRTELGGVYSMNDNLEFEKFVGEIDTYVYSGKSFAYGGNSTFMYGIEMSRDGNNVYLVDAGTSSQSIDRYVLSTPYDISTASFSDRITNITTSITGPGEGSPRGVNISDDGTILTFVGAGGDRVYNYYLPTPYSLTGAVYGNMKFRQVVGSGSGQDLYPHGLSFGDNGTKMYVVGYNNDRIYQWNLSTAWDVSSASYSNNSLYVGTQEGEPRGLFIGDNGTKVYVVGPTNDQVRQYNLGTAWNISTGTYFGGTSVLSQDSIQQGIYFKLDGTKMYMIGSTGDRVYQYSLSTAWDITTLTYDSVSAYVGTYDTIYSGVAFKSDGTRMYLVGDGSNTVDEYILSTPWNVSTASYNAEVVIGNSPLALGALYDIDVSSDGSKLYVLDGSQGVVQFDMIIPWQLNSLNIGYYSISAYSPSSTSLFFGDNGTKMYVSDESNDRVYQWNLSIPWIPTLGTTSYYSNCFVGSQEASPFGITFSKNGDRMFVVGFGSDTIYQYNLSTPWDISTASYSGKNRIVNDIDTAPRGLCSSRSMHKFYLLGDGNDRIYQYDYLFG